MGASIFWQSLNGKNITPGPRSKFVEALNLPRELDASDCDFLDGLAAGEPEFKKACDELKDAIFEHGRVRVWAEY